MLSSKIRQSPQRTQRQSARSVKELCDQLDHLLVILISMCLKSLNTYQVIRSEVSRQISISIHITSIDKYCYVRKTRTGIQF